jgi:hypothetical protein
MASNRHERGNAAWALRLRAEIAAHRAPSNGQKAAAQYQGALAVAQELEMRPLQAHCHLGLARLYRGIGRLEEARPELGIAVEMLRDMGMARWLPEAESELASLT